LGRLRHPRAWWRSGITRRRSGKQWLVRIKALQPNPPRLQWRV
jgi:hypothetical protein